VQGNAPIVLTTGAKATSAQNPQNPITIPLFGITYIENNASFSTPGTTTPGTIVSLFGNGFGTTTRTAGFPATSFQNVSVTFNGTPAPLFHLVNTAPSPGKPPFSLGASQIDLLMPYEFGDPNGKPLTTGNTTPADGSVLYETVVTPTITVGGFPAKVPFSGITPGFTGEYQIDFQVPDGISGDDVPVVFSVGSSPTDTRTMSIQAPAPL
jgi:hypothetical protein